MLKTTILAAVSNDLKIELSPRADDERELSVEENI
jgi:hypothetical protein